MTSRAFDVLVVGGGPAGSALSLRLARAGCAVAQLERTKYESFRVGESLPPNAARQLMRLGVWEQFLEIGPLPVQGVKSVWGSSELDSSSFLAHPLQNGWHLDRARFDRMLTMSASDAGAQVFTSTSAVELCRGKDKSWSAETVNGGRRRSLRARFLVDATGRSGNLGTSLGTSRLRVDHLVGIAITTVPEAIVDQAVPSLIESHQFGWWYSAGLANGSIVAIFFTDADLCSKMALTRPERLRLCLSEATNTCGRLRDARFPQNLRVFPAGSHRLTRASGDSWLAVGDSAIGRDPLSSSGIDFALASAQRSFEVICSVANGSKEDLDQYNEQIHSDFDRYLAQRNSYYAIEDRWPDSPFWRRRQTNHTSDIHQQPIYSV